MRVVVADMQRKDKWPTEKIALWQPGHKKEGDGKSTPFKFSTNPEWIRRKVRDR